MASPGNVQAPRSAAVLLPDDLPAPNLLASLPRYQQVKFINRGAHGVVVLALDKNAGEYVALKFIERGRKITKYVEREVLNQLRLRHPHIIALKEVFLTPQHLVIAMEYAMGGDMFRLMQRVGRMSEESARWYFQQIVLAVDFCHRMGVANRDIKLENSLLDGSVQPLVKLADFGCSKDENLHSAPGSCVGTPAYLAPEVLGNVRGQPYDGKKSDVWSCGVLLYILVTGLYPFGAPQVENAKLKSLAKMHAMVQRIKNMEYSFPPDVPLSGEIKDLIGSILVADPMRRPSTLQILQHPWFSKSLNPSILTFNDAMVAASLQDQLQAEMMDSFRSLVREANHVRRDPREDARLKTPLEGV